jgi:hypothetical protein
MAKFDKGWRGGPGRPRGSRNKSTLIFDAIGHDGIENLIRMVKEEAAEKRSLRAAAMLLARTWPRLRAHDQAVEFDLPPVENAEGIVQAHAALIAAVAAGEVTPDEATTLAALFDSQRRALETYDLAKQIQALKAAA